MAGFVIGGLAVDVVNGDITAQTVDAVVNAANNHFWMGAGVAGAIKARGGAQIEREAMALGPVTPGESVVTGAGQLPARFVIHAAVMGQDLQTDAALVARATETALQQAVSRGLETIAMPALGTGVGGLALVDCARAMLGAVQAHAQKATTLKRITFVLFGSSAHHEFEQAISRILRPSA